MEERTKHPIVFQLLIEGGEVTEVEWYPEIHGEVIRKELIELENGFKVYCEWDDSGGESFVRCRGKGYLPFQVNFGTSLHNLSFRETKVVMASRS